MSDQHQHRATPEQWAKTERMESGPYTHSSCLIELRDRIQLLEATQHAHIEAKAAEAGARRAVEQLRSTPGEWQPIRGTTTYSESDIKAAEMEWARTAPGMRSDDLRLAAAGAQVGRSSAAVDQVLALQDRIQEGTLTLAEALKEINGEPEPSANARQLTLVERVARRLARFASEGRPGDDALPIASAVLCEVADWLAEGSGRSGSWNTPAADLRHEANH